MARNAVTTSPAVEVLLCGRSVRPRSSCPRTWAVAGGELGRRRRVASRSSQGLCHAAARHTLPNWASAGRGRARRPDTLEKLAEGASIGARRVQRAVTESTATSPDVRDRVEGRPAQPAGECRVTIPRRNDGSHPVGWRGSEAQGQPSRSETDPGLADTARSVGSPEARSGAAGRLPWILTVAYTKDRVQFGRPNRQSFQGIKHRMADLPTRSKVQAARAVVNEAVADPTPTSAALARFAAKRGVQRRRGRRPSSARGIADHLGTATSHCTSSGPRQRALLGRLGSNLRRLEAEVL